MAQKRGEESRAVGTVSGDDVPDGGGPLNALPEMLRKTLAAGLSGFFLTEEAVRRALGDTLPKDWSDFAVDQSNRMRAEFLERLSFEIARSLESVDLAAVLSQLLEGRTLEVSAKVRLVPDTKGGKRPRHRIEVESG